MVKFKGKQIKTEGTVPQLHAKAPPFVLVDKDLKDRTLQEFLGKKILLSTVPSLDTDTCSRMAKHINALALEHPNFVCLTVSADLPFAQKRFCEKENTNHVLTLSMMRDKQFGKDYGLLIAEGPLKGLLARALFVISPEGLIEYVQIVEEITEEPTYEEALQSAR